MPACTKLYDRLGVDPTADKATIQKAYRRAAMQHHPDRGGDAKVFQEIEEAGRVLLDDQARAAYDETGNLPGGEQSLESRVRGMITDIWMHEALAGSRPKAAIAKIRQELVAQRDKMLSASRRLKDQQSLLSKDPLAAFSESSPSTKALTAEMLAKLTTHIEKLRADIEFVEAALRELGKAPDVTQGSFDQFIKFTPNS